MSATFAERLAHLRATKGLTQRELGAAAGIAWSMISKYEAGKSMPRLKVLIKLAEALGVSIDDLREGVPDQPEVVIYEGFSARLLEWRAKKKVSTRLLSKRAGIDTSVLNDFELGNISPSIDDLYILAEALGVSVSDLAGDKDEEGTVRLRLALGDSPDGVVTFATSAATYKLITDAAERFGITPEEVLAHLVEATAKAARDPENASPLMQSLLESMKSD